MPHRRGVARLDVDELLVDDDGGHLEVRLAQHLRQPPQHGEVAGELEVVDRARAAGRGRCAGRTASARRARRTASARRAAGSPAARRRRSRPWAAWSAAVRRRAGRGWPAPGRPAASRPRARFSVKVRTSCRVSGTRPPSTRTLHLRQVPWPPQVESIAIPFHDAASKTVTPGGTRTPRCVGALPGASATVNARSTRPVPSCGVRAVAGGWSSPSRRTSSSEKGGSGMSVTRSRPERRPRLPRRPWRRGHGRSTPCPSRRGRGRRRRPSRPPRSAGCGCP